MSNKVWSVCAISRNHRGVSVIHSFIKSNLMKVKYKLVKFSVALIFDFIFSCQISDT